MAEGPGPHARGELALAVDTTTDSWEPLPLDECSPEPRSDATFTAFGDGKSALLWGGFTPDLAVEQGRLFTP
jgi:hypothetical protein